MAKLVIVGVLLAGALLLVAAIWPQAPDPYRVTVDWAAASATATAIAGDADRAQAQASALQPLITLALALLVVGVVVFALALLVVGVYRLWAMRNPLVFVQVAESAVPLDRRLIHAGATAQLPAALIDAGIQRAIALGPQQPHTYSPSIHYNNRIDGQGAPQAALAAPSAYTPPTFAEMRQAGLLGPGKPLIYGYNAETGQPITGDWRLLQSGAIAGYSGEGKSNTAAFIAGQAYEQGNVKLLLCDPHAASGADALSARLAPLGDAFLLPPAQTDGEIVAALSAARDLVRQRLAAGPPHPFKLLVIIDEFTYLMSRSTVAGDAADLVEMIAQEGRKTDTACQVIGQVFGAQRAGSTALRDSLQGVIVHRMRRAQARLLVDPESARLAETLTRGRALFSRGADVIPIAIPRCNVEDLSRPAARATIVERAAPVDIVNNVNNVHEDRGVLLTGDWWESLTGQRTAPAAVDGTPDGTPGVVDGMDGMDGTPPDVPDPYVKRVVAMFLVGTPIKEIIRQCHPEINIESGGRPYRDKRDDVEDLIRAELRRRSPYTGEAI